MKTEKVLVIIKPDTVLRGLNEDVKNVFINNKFSIQEAELRHLSEKQCLFLQSEGVTGKDHATCADYMQTGPCEILILVKENAIAEATALIGDPDPAKAEQGTIRARFGIDGIHNSVYISPAKTTAKEVAYFEEVLKQDKE